jgi:hypothetical protein
MNNGRASPLLSIIAHTNAVLGSKRIAVKRYIMPNPAYYYSRCVLLALWVALVSATGCHHAANSAKEKETFPFSGVYQGTLSLITNTCNMAMPENRNVKYLVSQDSVHIDFQEKEGGLNGNYFGQPTSDASFMVEGVNACGRENKYIFSNVSSTKAFVLWQGNSKVDENAKQEVSLDGPGTLCQWQYQGNVVRTQNAK